MADRSETELRDRAAVVRTHLANERTLLAYVRTALAFAITGIGAIKFFDSPLIVGFGMLSTAAAVITAIVGAVRFYQVRSSLRRG